MELPMSMFSATFSALSCIAQVILVFIGTWYIATILPLYLAILYVLQRIYIRTSRQLRFLEIEWKAPLVTKALEAFDGLASIRAFGYATEFERRNTEALQLSQRPIYLLYCAQRWLNLVLDLIVASIATALALVAALGKSRIDSSLLAVALTNIVGLGTSLKGVIVAWTFLETSIGAVARNKAFVETMESEDKVTENRALPEAWPQHGRIILDNVTASYGYVQPVSLEWASRC